MGSVPDVKYLVFRGEEQGVLRVESSLGQEVHVLLEHAAAVNARLFHPVPVRESYLNPTLKRRTLKNNEEKNARNTRNKTNGMSTTERTRALLLTQNYQ